MALGVDKTSPYRKWRESLWELASGGNSQPQATYPPYSFGPDAGFMTSLHLIAAAVLRADLTQVRRHGLMPIGNEGFAFVVNDAAQRS